MGSVPEALCRLAWCDRAVLLGPHAWPLPRRQTPDDTHYNPLVPDIRNSEREGRWAEPGAAGWRWPGGDCSPEVLFFAVFSTLPTSCAAHCLILSAKRYLHPKLVILPKGRETRRLAGEEGSRAGDKGGGGRR
ncbi:hypothetical protein E2C01_042888 [Portunus trituberculatus]|uniref:Uncharacterized protein n=1 Tax=Portunus trituberculatus TaxID=210409 RepID=A0A5B7FXQ6_PORTR|nr:hypothetical protein [Portunus trituberculatus]